MSTLRNIAWGILNAAWGVAACMAIVALAIWGDHSLPGGEFAAFLRFYGVMGVIAGVVLGVGRPFLGSALGRGVVGFLVGLPVFYVAIFYPPMGDGADRDSFSIAAWLALSAFLGPVGAAYVTIRNRQREEKVSRPDA